MRATHLYNPVRLIFAKNSRKRLGRLLKVDGVANVLLVTGLRSAEASGLLAELRAGLHKQGVGIVHQVRVNPGPCVEDLRPAAEKVKEAQAVLAVGGGSVLDAAKILAAAPFLPDLWSPIARGEDVRRALPMYALPTLSGSGSEVNDQALLTSREHGRKTAARGPALFPRAAVVDPQLQVGLPLALTARSAMDAFGHVFEHYVLAKGQETAMAVAEAIMRSLLVSVEALRQDCDAYAPRADLAWAAILAQNGIAASDLGGGEWTVHILAHVLEVLRPGVAHADLASVLFPAWVERVQDKALGLFCRWARAVWERDSGLAGAAAWRERLTQWGAPVSLRQLGMTRADLELAAHTALAWHNPLGRRFPLDLPGATSLLLHAW